MTVITAPLKTPQAKRSLPGWLRTVSLLRESPVGMIGAFLVLFWCFVAIFAPWIAPFNPNANLYEIGVNTPPTWANWLGTDDQARDLLSRIIYGARVSLTIGLLGVTVSFTLGILLGGLAGYYGGRVDLLIMRWIDIMLAFPYILLALAIVSGPRAAEAQSRVARIGLLGPAEEPRFSEIASALRDDDRGGKLQAAPECLPHTHPPHPRGPTDVWG